MTMKLVHKSGLIICQQNYPVSYWGCKNQVVYGNNALLTIITNAKKEAVLPPAEDLKTILGSNYKSHFYNLNEITHTSPELVFRDLPIQVVCVTQPRVSDMVRTGLDRFI